MLKRWIMAVLCGLVTACGSETKVDTQATGISLSVERPSALALDQLRLRIDNDVESIYGPVFVPETPRALEITETVVILIDPARAGETLTVTVNGYRDGGGVASGEATAAIAAHALTEATAALVQESVAACGDGTCLGSENYCSCPADCAVVCGDGCCTSPAERKQNCPSDCR